MIDPARTIAKPEGEAAQFWESHYQAHRPTKRPHVNPLLATAAELLPPGAALDLGCGTGGDTLWLAERGWRVTAVDISLTALEFVAEIAGALGLSDRVVTECHDLSRSLPDGGFNLVSAQYLHTPVVISRQRILRAAAETLVPGGRLLVVDHGSIAPWSWNKDPETHFPTPQELAAELHLDPTEWLIERADMPHRQATGPDGQTAEVVDHVLGVRRRGTSLEAPPPGLCPSRNAPPASSPTGDQP